MYDLYALIGKRQTFKALPFQSARLVTLEQDVAMIPLTDELCEEIGSSDLIENFQKLSSEIEKWARQMSSDGFIGYIEAEFFGGAGGQGAVAWNSGSRVLEPIYEQNAINRVLKLLGANPKGHHDEFDAVGLGKHRGTNDWK